MNTRLLGSDITERVLVSFQVHREPGTGFLESVYAKAMSFRERPPIPHIPRPREDTGGTAEVGKSTSLLQLHRSSHEKRLVVAG